MATEKPQSNEWEIDGEFTFPGELSVGGQFIVGPLGKVVADIATVDAVILGSYAGALRASGRIYVSMMGVVSGSLQAPEIVVAEGATVTAEIVRAAPARATETPKQVEAIGAASPTATAAPIVEVERDVEIFIPARPNA
jgi:cytoskeletal protein CcmA (bactofilin family)